MSSDYKILNTIVSSSPHGIIYLDDQLHIKYFSPVAEEITGYKAEELIGQKCKYLCKSDACDSECPVTYALKKGQNIYSFDTLFDTSSGNLLPVRINIGVKSYLANNDSGVVIAFRERKTDHKLPGSEGGDKHFYGVVGKSKKMEEVFQLIREIADSDAPVLISGETGTGKELIANAVQATSKRHNQKFVKVNCSVLPSQLLSSELFGHNKGAFTGAYSDRIGRFEFANNGTIMLDEIAELPIEMQPLLLRVLQDGTYQRIGESDTRRTNARIISATNVDIDKAAKEGKLRLDLLYRLNVIHIQVPPLRQRKGDIVTITHYFIKRFSKIYNKNITDIDNDAMELLLEYHWPGNIRELENVIERAFFVSKKNFSICICGLPEYIREKAKCSKSEDFFKRKSKITRDDISELLKENNGNKSRVAKILGVHRSTIWRHMKNDK